MGLLLLAESGLWAGTAAAYTAFAVMKKFSFSAGPSYSEPFTVEQQAYLRSIYQQLTTGVTGPLTVLTSPGATGIDGAFLGPWGMAENLAQANAIIQRYLDYNKKWKVSIAVPGAIQTGGVSSSARSLAHHLLSFCCCFVAQAAVAVSWFALGSTFLVMVVHFALPFVWKWLGLLRQPKHQKGYYNEV